MAKAAQIGHVDFQSMSDARNGRPRKRNRGKMRQMTFDLRAAMAVLPLVMIAIAVSSFYYTGYYASDDMSYLGGARNLLDYGVLNAGFGANRTGMIAMIAVLLKVTGGSVFLTAYAFVFFHAALVMLCYGIGRVAHDHMVGLGSAAIVAVFPLAYFYAGALLPDVASTVAIAAALLCLLMVVRGPEYGAARDRHDAILAFAAGICTGLGYMIKEPAIIFVVPAGLILLTAAPLRSRRTITLVLSYGLAIVLVLAGEALLYRIVSGEWIIRLNFSSQPERTLQEWRSRLPSEGLWPWQRIITFYRTLWYPLGPWTAAFTAAFLVYPVLHRFAWPGRSTAMASFSTGLWLWLYLLLGTTTASAYVPGPIQARYFVVLAPFWSVASSYVLVALARRLKPALSRMANSAGAPAVRILPQLLLIAVVAFFGLQRLAATNGSAGLIYGARDVKAFLAAYRDGLNDPVGHHVVPSQYYAGRMRALFPKEYNWQTATFYGPELINALVQLKEPFLFLAPTDKTKQSPYDGLRAAANEGQVTLTPITLNRADPSKSRWKKLVESLSPLAEGVPERRAMLVRVEPKQAPAGVPAPESPDGIAITAPWFATSTGYTTFGNWLTWQARARSVGSFQLFDRESQRSPPRSDAARLPPNTKSIEVALVAGSTVPLELTVTLYGYSGTALAQQTTTKINLAPGQLSSISVKTSGVYTLEAYRVRLTVKLPRRRPGLLVVRNVSLKSVHREDTARDCHGSC